MLEDSLTYPTKGDSGIARILIGGGLLLFSFLIVPLFAVMGYFVQTLVGASRGETEPPAFEDWGALIVDGLKAFVVSIAYSLVPLVLFVVLMLVIGFGAPAGGDSAGTGALFAGVGILMMLLYLVVALVINYVLPAAITNFAREGSIGAAFDFEALKPVLTSGSYVKAVLLMFGVALVVGVAFSIFAMITLGLGYIAAPFVYFYIYLAGAYMFGTAFGDVAGIEQSGTGPTDAAPIAD